MSDQGNTEFGTNPPQIEEINSIEEAQLLISSAEKISVLPTILKEANIILFGDNHIDYSIPQFLISKIQALKDAGITSFGFELISPTEENLAILREVNQGNFSRLNQLDFSGGWGSIKNKELRIKLVEELVKAGIEVYLFAPWSRTSYQPSMKKEAAETIYNHSRKGKTAVLLGAQHSFYRKGKYSFVNPHVVDYLTQLFRRENEKVMSLIFTIRMIVPGEYDRSPEGLIRKAQKLMGGIREPKFVTNPPKKHFPCDGMILLPEVPFIPPPSDKTK